MTGQQTENPYAPPQNNPLTPTVPEGGDFSIGDALSQGWSATTSNFGLVLGVGITAFILTMVSAMTVIGYILVVPILMWGGIRFLLNVLNSEAEFNDIFSGFSNYGKVLGRTLLLGVVLVALSIVGNSLYYVGMFSESEVLITIGFLANLAFVFVVMVRVYFAPYILVDSDLGAIESISASWNMTRGKTLKLIGFAILSGIVGMSGVILLGVGVFLTMPVAYMMWTSAYRQMVPRQ